MTTLLWSRQGHCPHIDIDPISCLDFGLLQAPGGLWIECTEPDTWAAMDHLQALGQKQSRDKKQSPVLTDNFMVLPGTIHLSSYTIFKSVFGLHKHILKLQGTETANWEWKASCIMINFKSNAWRKIELLQFHVMTVDQHQNKTQ